MAHSDKKNSALLVALIIITIWSFIDPFDRVTWIMEVLPVFIFVPILIATHKKFPLTPLLYSLIFLHAVILLVGGHYTYSEMPLFNWLQDEFNLTRNHYDRVGHFAQGFVPALGARELLLRTSPLKEGRWMFTLIVLSILGVSASYELIEWSAAVVLDEGADNFLATQGDVWDTQKDMALAGVGAILSLLTLKSLHNKQLEGIKS